MVASAALFASLRVLVLGLLAPRSATLSVDGASVTLSADGDNLIVEEAGVARQVPELRLPRVGSASAGVLLQVDHLGRAFLRRYPGAMVARASRGHLRLVNEVDVERYVAQVVASELSDAPQAAAEALAIVVRTFTHFSFRRPRHGGEPLCDTTHCQVYRGAVPSLAAATAAAAATTGLLLARAAAPVAAYFTASCGGSTADAAAVWGGPAQAQLRPRPCLDCQQERQSWESEFSMKELEGVLSAAGHLAPDCSLSGVKIAAREPGGAVRRVHARCRMRAEPMLLSGEALRMAVGRQLGWNRLPSARFELLSALDAAEDVLRLAGRGQGHGVGLCLHGAVGRAKVGWDRSQILSHYFPDTQVGPFGVMP